MYIVFVSLLGYGYESEAPACLRAGKSARSKAIKTGWLRWRARRTAGGSSRAQMTFNNDGGVDCAAVASDGRTFVAGEAMGRVYFLRLENR